MKLKKLRRFCRKNKKEIAAVIFMASAIIVAIVAGK